MIREQNLANRSDNKDTVTLIAPHVMGTLWAAVFDSQVAKIFQREGSGFQIVEKFHSGPKIDDGLNNATIGRSGAAGSGRHKYEPSMEESLQWEIAFAKDISGWLEKARNKNEFDALILVGGPRMLGEVRKNLGKNLISCIIAESDKDLAHHDARDLEDRLMKLAQRPAAA